jgi:hypothetical protein
LLRHAQRIVDLNSEIAHVLSIFVMSEKQLDRSQIAGLAVDPARVRFLLSMKVGLSSLGPLSVLLL